MPVIEVTHPLVQHKLSYLRDKDTPTVHFRKLVNELTLLLTYEATKDLPTEPVEIETPLETMQAQRISGKKVAVCPILRAGVGMLDGVLSLISGLVLVARISSERSSTMSGGAGSLTRAPGLRGRSLHHAAPAG
jgi:uracil phosphoribosyltransferase